MNKKKDVKSEISSEKKEVGKKQSVAKRAAVKSDSKSNEEAKPVVSKSKAAVKIAVVEPVNTAPAKSPEDIIAEFPAEQGPGADLHNVDKTELVAPEANEEKKKEDESAVPEPKGSPIIDFKRTAFKPDYTITIRIYENGRVEYNKHSVESGFNEDKKFSVRPEETKFYADKLIEIGFLNFKKKYKQKDYVNEGFYDCTTLNYNGNKKTVSCTNKEENFEKYYELISNLVSLNFNNIRKKIKINVNLNKVSKIVAGIAILILIFFLILSIQPKSTIEMYEPRVISNIVPETKAVPLSIAELMGITKSGYEENVSLLVFLRKEEVRISEEVTSVYQYVVDDYNNKILVSISGIQKNAAYGPLFTESPQTFRVTGVLKNTYKGLLLEVNTIVPEERNTIVTENTVTETVMQLRNETVPAKLNLSFGLNRVGNFFG